MWIYFDLWSFVAGAGFGFVGGIMFCAWVWASHSHRDVDDDFDEHCPFEKAKSR